MALIVRSLAPYAVVPVFAILMHRVFIRVEEQMLEKKFGQAWLEYANKVRRWLKGGPFWFRTFWPTVKDQVESRGAIWMLQ